MNAPPYVEPSVIETEPSPPARNLLGWIVLGVLFLLYVASVVQGFSANQTVGAQGRLLTDLRTGLVMRELGNRMPFGRSADASLQRIEREVAPTRTQDPESAALWVAVRTELGEKVAPGDFRPARDSKRIDLHAIGEAYALRPASRDGAEALAAKLDERGALSHLAAVHLREAAGIPGARQWIRGMADRYLASLAIYAFVGMASMVAWGVFLALSVRGLPTKGPPFVAKNLGVADRMAFQAAALFAAFQVAGYVLGLFGLSPAAKIMLSGVSMFFVLPMVLRRGPSFEEVVAAREGFGTKVGLGLWGFLLEIPVTLTAAGIGGWLFRGLPQADHPATTALMNTRDPFLVASLFFAAAVVAPFWEETMFRGLLFPALRRVMGGIVPAAFLSSFLFASIHPQGPGGWIGLMAFALCSCVLTVRTGSLVPSMFLHAAHNGTLLALALLLGT